MRGNTLCFLIHHLCACVKQLLDPLRGSAVTAQFRVDPKQFMRRILRFFQHDHVAAEIGNFQCGQTMLPLAEEITRSAQLEILLGDFEAVRGFRHNREPLAGIFIFIVGNEDAI